MASGNMQNTRQALLPQSYNTYIVDPETHLLYKYTRRKNGQKAHKVYPNKGLELLSLHFPSKTFD